MGHIAITTIRDVDGTEKSLVDIPLGHIASMSEITKVGDLPDGMQKTYKGLKAAGQDVVCAVLGFSHAHKGEENETVILPSLSAGILRTQLAYN